MKIRNGFVSNSSSSSFAIYGVFKDSDEIKAMLEQAGVEIKTSGKYDDGIGSTLREALKDTRLETDGYDYRYIGRPLNSIRDDETGAQFKQSVQDDMLKVFKHPVKCNFEEGEVER